MQSVVLHSLRKRPLASFSAATITTGLSYAYFTESQANRQEELGVSPSLPRHYNRPALHAYWSKRPLTVLKRMGALVNELGPIVGTYIWDFQLFPSDNQEVVNDLQQVHAVRLKDALTRLGPAFVKAGQQLSIRYVSRE
jgi:hypothetical protein